MKKSSLQSKKDFVGVAGFEPAASCSQSRRDNRATLHPEAGANIKLIFAYPNYFEIKMQSMKLFPKKERIATQLTALARMETASFCGGVRHKRYSVQPETASKNQC